jgi:hypothetical protein
MGKHGKTSKTIAILGVYWPWLFLMNGGKWRKLEPWPSNMVMGKWSEALFKTCVTSWDTQRLVNIDENKKLRRGIPERNLIIQETLGSLKIIISQQGFWNTVHMSWNPRIGWNENFQ